MESVDPPSRGSRVYPRVPVSARASIRVVGKDETLTGRVVNLSRSGALIEAAPLPQGTRIRTSFLGLDIRAQVVRTIESIEGSGSGGIAVRFEDLQEPDWKTIRVRRD